MLRCDLTCLKHQSIVPHDENGYMHPSGSRLGQDSLQNDLFCVFVLLQARALFQQNRPTKKDRSRVCYSDKEKPSGSLDSLLAIRAQSLSHCSTPTNANGCLMTRIARRLFGDEQNAKTYIV